MIVGIGVDLVEIERMRSLVARHGNRARRRLFTSRELADCEARHDAAECLAASFAAKEAALKALGTGKRPDLSWTDIEVARDDSGRPELRLSGGVNLLAGQLGVAAAWLSLSHEAGLACATVVLEGPED